MKNPDQKYLLMRNDKARALDDSQIREILRTELESGIQKLRRNFGVLSVSEVCLYRGIQIERCRMCASIQF